MRKSLAVLFSALALTLTACTAGVGPDVVAQDFLKAVDRQDADGMLAHLFFEGITVQKMPEKKGVVRLAVTAPTLVANGGLDRMAVVSSTLDEHKTNATVRLNVTYRNGKSEEMKFTLRNGEDGWKVVTTRQTVSGKTD